jgi:hypothetical protein
MKDKVPGAPFSVFHYHANAHVVSAQFTRPVHHLVEVQGASSLPTIGGHGKGTVHDFRFEHFLSVKHGYTHVSGSVQEKVEQNDKGGKVTVKYHTTLVTSVAEGVNILDVVTADRIIGRMASSYREGDEESTFTHIGSKFENLHIAGCDTKVEVNLKLIDLIPTFQEATNQFEKGGDFKKIAEEPFSDGNKLEKQPLHGAYLCSIVDMEKLRTACPGVKPEGHCFVIPKFGKLYLGELLVQYGRRTLTMLRFDLGSPVSANGTVVQADSNGQNWPPTHK